MSPKFNLDNQLGIKNFRSFDEDGIYLDHLSKINLLIGKNNCGKSNILKFLKLVSGLEGAWGSFPNTSDNGHRGSTKPASVFFRVTHRELGLPYMFTSSRTGTEMGLAYALTDPLTFEYEFKNDNFKMEGWKPKNISIDGKYVYYDENDVCISIMNHLQINGQAHLDLWKIIETHFKASFLQLVRNYFSNIIYIPDFREINDKKDDKRTAFTSSISGRNIISELNKMKNPDYGEERNSLTFKEIEETVKYLLNVSNLSIEVPHTKDKIIVNIEGNRLPLENLGTGIHEIVLLCSALLLHPENIVCIEEPEIHLYPDLQRRFIKFLDGTKNKYFITTHSNVFLDENNPSLSVFHVTYDNRKSMVSKAITSCSVRHIVEDLGYRASDLLQSNGVIWVEGPSDRTYLKRWLSLINPNLMEGIHFSIMFYGGKLLSHLTFEEEFLNDEFIKVQQEFICYNRQGLSERQNQ